MKILARVWGVSGAILVLIAGCTAAGTPSPEMAVPPVESPANDAQEMEGSPQMMTETPADPDPTEEASPETSPTGSGVEEPAAEPADTPSPVDGGIASAVADLAARLGIAESAITVVSAEAVTWPDSSLGCPQPGYAYMQVLTEGRLIVLEANGVTYNYHSGGGQAPFLCEQRLIVPEITPKGGDESVPPPGSGEDT